MHQRLLVVGAVGYWAALTAATHWPGLDLGGGGPDPGGLGLDKVAHAVAWAALSGWVWPLVAGREQRWAAVIGAASLLLTLAGLDEWTQQFVEREVSWADWRANAVGVALGFAMGWRVWGWRPVESGDPGEGSATPATRAGSVPEAEAGDRSSLGVAAVVVAGWTLVSRVLGLARDAALVALVGIGTVLDTFFLAFLIPNLFRRLFGEGALTAAFLPRYRATLRTPRVAAAYAASVAGWAGRWVGLGVLAGWAVLGAARGLDWIGGPVAGLTALMLPYAWLVCRVALLGAAWQARGVFWRAALAPVVLNLAVLAAAFGAWAAGLEPAEMVWTVGAAVVLAGLGQWAVTAGGAGASTPAHGGALPESGAQRELPRGVEASALSLLRETRLAMVPVLIGLGVFQLNTLLDGLLAYGLSGPGGPVEAGGLSRLTAAQRLYQFPLGVFGLAVATAVFPALAAARSGAFQRTLASGLTLSIGIGLPATAGLVLVAEPLVRLVFERGAFDASESAAVAGLLRPYALGVWAYGLNHVLTRGFHARRDTTTPLRVGLVVVAVNLTLNLTLIWPLGVAGLAWSTAACGAVQLALLWGHTPGGRRLWRRGRTPGVKARQGRERHVWPEVVEGSASHTWLRGLGGALVGTAAVAVAVGLLRWLCPPAGLPWVLNLIWVGSAVGLGAGAYLAVRGLAWVQRAGG